MIQCHVAMGHIVCEVTGYADGVSWVLWQYMGWWPRWAFPNRSCMLWIHHSWVVARETSDMTYFISITIRWPWLLVVIFIIFIEPSNTGMFLTSVVFWLLSRWCPLQQAIPFAGYGVFARWYTAFIWLAAAWASMSHVSDGDENGMISCLLTYIHVSPRSSHHEVVSIDWFAKLCVPVKGDQQHHCSPIINQMLLLVLLIAPPNSMIKLNLNMGSATHGLPMVVLLLIPPNISRVMSIYL